ncbi:hypothetical protein SDC9_90427 [bioreactor metagenome]|uniref:Uncharacterized protein n=1 Tax=bioreactor metagenome TaxID=1076179 RepID=A0A644ZS18_9ZZZZ
MPRSGPTRAEHHPERPDGQDRHQPGQPPGGGGDGRHHGCDGAAGGAGQGAAVALEQLDRQREDHPGDPQRPHVQVEPVLQMHRHLACPRSESPLAHDQPQGQVERLAHQRLGEHLAGRAAGDDPSLLQQHGVGDARRDLLHMVGHHDAGGCRRVGGEVAQQGHQLLPAAEVEPGGRLVEQEQLRVDHQATGDLDALALPRAERAERTVPQRQHPEPVEQGVGPLVVEALVLLMPASDHRVRRGHHQVVDRLTARHAFLEGLGDQADARAQVEDVHRPEHLVEDPGHPGGRVEVAGQQPQQGGLAGAVGAEDHPAVRLPDLPVDALEHHGVSPPDTHIDQIHHSDHGPEPTCPSRAPRTWLAARAGPFPYPPLPVATAVPGDPPDRSTARADAADVRPAGAVAVRPTSAVHPTVGGADVQPAGAAGARSHAHDVQRSGTGDVRLTT